MNLLLDTHAFVWWIAGDHRLSPTARDCIADSENRVYVSSASGWEIATKHRLGKLPEAEGLVHALPQLIQQARFADLPIDMAHAIRAGSLPGPHRDPFDRMLIAQAEIEGLSVVTLDPIFACYGVSVLW